MTKGFSCAGLKVAKGLATTGLPQPSKPACASAGSSFSSSALESAGRTPGWLVRQASCARAAPAKTERAPARMAILKARIGLRDISFLPVWAIRRLPYRLWYGCYNQYGGKAWGSSDIDRGLYKNVWK